MATLTYTTSVTANFQRIEYNLIGKLNQVTTVTQGNWAFIDIQNLYQSVKKEGWRINWKLFRDYLKNEYNVTRAVVFLGYVKGNEYYYNLLKKSGFVLEFRPVFQLPNGDIDGGNVDADLASYVMDFKNEYNKAVIVADDGDYLRTIKSLMTQNKLQKIISSHSIQNTSRLIKQVALHSILSIESLKHIIEFNK